MNVYKVEENEKISFVVSTSTWKLHNSKSIFPFFLFQVIKRKIDFKYSWNTYIYRRLYLIDASDILYIVKS